LEDFVKLRSAITVCAVPQASAGPFVFHGASAGEFSANLHLAKEIGFDAVELFLPDSKQISASDTKIKLESLSLDLAAVGSGAGWVVHQLSLTAKENLERNRAIDFVKSLIDWAGLWAAPVIIGSMQGQVAVDEDRSEVLNRLGDSLNQISEYAATRYKSHVFYEPLNRYETNLFTRIGDAAQWLASQSLSNVLILADLFHMNIEEVDLASAITDCSLQGKNWIGHVHWADSNRQAMGLGHTNVAPIAAALMSIDYQGYLSGEVFPTPDSQTAAKQTLHSIQSSFQQ
jgi:hydroxypyruvate isomerase